MSTTSVLPLQRNHLQLRIYLLLSAIEGLPALAWFFLLPSEPGSAFFAGLSAGRLALVVITLLIDLGLWGVVYRGIKNPRWLDRIQAYADRELISDRLLVPLVISFGLLIVVFIAVIASLMSVTPENYLDVNNQIGSFFPFVYATGIRLLPLITWGAVVVVQSLLGMVVHYRGYLLQKGTWELKAILYTAFAWVASAFTLIHWGILVFKLRTLHDIPGYYWLNSIRPFSRRDGFFAVILIILTFTTWLYLKRKTDSGWRILPFLYGLGYALILGIGFVSGQGIESIRLRYAATLHSQYAAFAVQMKTGVLSAIRNYDATFSSSMFTRTKPPGVMGFYILLEQLVKSIAPQPNFDAGFRQLTLVIAWVFPLLGLLSTVVIYLFLRKIIQPPDARVTSLLAPALFILAPNILLLSVFLDSALYPILFLAGAGLVVLSFKRQRLWLAILTGAYLYFAVFMTFSMLPLFGFVLLYAAIDFWLNRNERPLWREVKTLAGIAIGTLALFALFAWGLNYPFFPRFQMAAAVVHNYDFYLRVNLDPTHPVTSLQGRINQIVQADWLNNIEFAAAVGVLVYCLFLLRGIKVILAFIRRTATAADGIQAALFGTFVAMNLTGSMRGESARLWMFWVPVVVIFSAIEVAPLVKKRPAVFSILLLAQMVSLVLIFHFQDLLVV